MFSHDSEQRSVRVRYSSLGQDDLEVAQSEGSDRHRGWNYRKRLGCCVYILIIFLFFVSGASFVNFDYSPEHIITGVSLLACGLYLTTNSEVLIAFWSLLSEYERSRRTKKSLTKLVRKQVAQLHRLRTARLAFQALDERFNAVGAGFGAVQKAVQELPQVLAELKVSAAQHVPTLCRLYVHNERSHHLRAEAEVSEALDILSALLENQFADVHERMMVLEGSLQATLFYRDQDGIDVGTLAEIVTKALLAEDGPQITAAVNEVMNQAHERVREERRKAWESDPANKLAMEVEELQAHEELQEESCEASEADPANKLAQEVEELEAQE